MNFGTSSISCWWQRTFDHRQPAWLITLSVSPNYTSRVGIAFPQSRAVVDDFGTLVIVGDWL